MPQLSALIFFATANWGARPYRPHHYALAWLARVLTLSRISHVSIGYDGAVLDPSMRGNRFWPLWTFSTHYPRLTCIVSVPLKTPIDMDRYPPDGRKPIWPTVWRWATFGNVPTRDCVCIVASCLRDGGVNVPSYIVSPGQLHKWLTRRGYQSVRLKDDTA